MIALSSPLRAASMHNVPSLVLRIVGVDGTEKPSADVGAKGSTLGPT